MFTLDTLLAITLTYLILLFGVAYAVDRLGRQGRSLIRNPLVYSLSIAVYCTSWTYFGSVGLAARTGPLFLAVYVGPTLVAFSWWILLRKMVRVCRDNQIRSIADFMAFRYGNNIWIGGIVAMTMIVGMAPYIGLQLKAVDSSLAHLLHPTPGAAGDVDFALMVAILIGLFGILFSARVLTGSEKHEGMVAVVALESLIKLVALLAVGAWVTWGVFDGFTDILDRINSTPEFSHLLLMDDSGALDIPSWPSLLVLSACAIMLLPRQFHMMVVENTSEKHIVDAMWLFPLYLFLINLFILPIAFGGLLVFGGGRGADAFVLTLPLAKGQPVMALVAHIGGLAAATGMIIVSSVALSTMFLNNICMPIAVRLPFGRNVFPELIDGFRLIGIQTVCLVGYLYHRATGDTLHLVNIGLLSFGAATQLAPAFFGGLFWRQSTAKGAFAGLTAGLLLWLYLFLTPSFCLAGVLPASWLTHGPWGIGLLRPNALFGLEGLDMWSHGLFWTILINGGLFVMVSSLTRPGRSELEQVAKLIYVEGVEGRGRSELKVGAEPTIGEFEDLLGKFLGPQKSYRHLREFFGSNYDRDQKLKERDLTRLRRLVEKLIGGVIGPSVASDVVERYLALKGTRMEEMLDVFGSISVSLENSREELENRVRELAVLFKAARLVTATLDERKATDEVLGLLENDFGIASLGVFFVVDGVLKPGRMVGLHPRLVERLEGAMPTNSLVGRAVQSRVTVRGSVRETPSSLELLPRFGLMSGVAVPMIKENEVLGVLFVARRSLEDVLSDKLVSTLEALAGELVLSIANARLYNEIKELNLTLEEKVRSRTAELEAANENLKLMDRVKSEFLANVSHELRTPMNSIIGYTNLVIDGVDGPITSEQARSLERVEANARHLLNLINDLLDISRIESGKLRLELSPVDLGEIAREVGEDLSGTAQIKGLALSVEVPDRLPIAWADPVRVREVIINLVNNAIKFTTEGSVAIRVGLSVHKGEEGILVQVADTGPGIPEKDRGSIFEAFRQLDGSSTRAHGGVGLGLNIAKKLVEMHGGWIEVNSEVGVGSTFKVWWPTGKASTAGAGADG